MHGPALERSEEARRESVTLGPGRRPSSSLSDTVDMVDRWRRSTSQVTRFQAEKREELCAKSTITLFIWH